MWLIKHMDATNIGKLLNAGFTVICAEDHHFYGMNMRIKYKSKTQRDWATLEKGFASKAALHRRMKELLHDSMTVKD